ncbi:mycofactocin system glycosyltransferase [Mycolicibacterium litorale]|nr:mycofactocin system glycosyltransferase [Mycolicibacterium litorale]
MPAGRRVALDTRIRLWGNASVVLGGSPWGVMRIAPAGRPFVRRLKEAGGHGLIPAPGVEHALADQLVTRGIVHPLTVYPAAVTGVDVIVPAYERPDLLDACLTSLSAATPDARIVVVDDASNDPAVAQVASTRGAILVRHPVNRGPAAARNSGLRESTSPIVAFVDADCAATPGWLPPLVAHFDDPRVGAVAPRIRPRSASRGLLSRYEAARSALDMGPRPELVAYGAPLGFLPSAALLVRRSALRENGFDEDMRVGEDVDLIWRLVDDGWLVRYEPASTMTHQTRPNARGWARQVFGYGTSAAALDSRHPGRLVPARLSGWNIAIALLLMNTRLPRPVGVAGAVGGTALVSALLARSLRPASVDPSVAPYIVGKGLVSDMEAVGHWLRREAWPLGWLALFSAPRSRWARLAAAAMVVPIVREWFARRPDVDLPRYIALHLAEDAAYGSGVIAGARGLRSAALLAPRVRLPHLPRRAKTGQANLQR